MTKARVTAGGGWRAITFCWSMARKAGGVWTFYKRMRTRNACKTCAVGMGGQAGGMTNEAGHFPEFCKKSVEAQARDMQAPIPESYFTTVPIKLMQRLSSRQLDDLGRLAFPMIAEAGDQNFRRISWDEALDRAGAAIAATEPDEFFLYCSGRSSNEAAFLSQLVVRAYGSANIHNCSYYCHQASGVGLKQVYGSGTASVILEDLGKADFAMVIGCNPASNHPRLITQLMLLRRRGGKVLVINPLKELGLVRFKVPSDWRSLLFGSKISDLYLQPRIGSDIALLKAILKGVIERKALDENLIRNHTEGWEAVKRDVETADWDELSKLCAVSLEEIDRAIDLIVDAKRGIFMWAMGLTHHAFGVDNILAVANLALARGFIGRPGVGLLPIRGHSNVQGIGSVGVTPAVTKSFAAKLEEIYGIEVPEQPGKDTYSSMAAAERGDIRAAILLGGNLYGSNPDTSWAGRAINAIDTVVHINTKLNTGLVNGRGKTAIVLPALVRDEERQCTTQESMFNYVRVSEGGASPTEGPDNEMRSEVDIIASLAERMLSQGQFDWAELRSHASLRRAMAEAVPGYEAIGDTTTDTTTEFQIGGRTFHEPTFKTESGRAVFHVTPLPDQQDEPDVLCLMTLRSEGQFNTVVYDDVDLYRGTDRRDVVMMSATDAERLGLNDDDRVMVETPAGSMEASVAIVDISTGGIAMYYPEANVLVPQRVDSRSKTPAFKSVAARVVPLGAAAKQPLRVVKAS